MLKKFLIGTLAAVALLVGVTASAAYDFGTTTLKVGSTGEAVKNVQIVVGASPVDGVFGLITKAKVMVWQAANGLVADGYFGAASKAKANGTTTTTTTTVTTGALSGGAGDADVAHYGTGEKSEIVEGDSEIKGLGFKVEAIDSDIAVTNVKIQIENQETSTSASKITKYLDSVDIYKGSTKVGSADASDFSKESGTINYTKTIALSNAVVKDGDKDPFYVMLNAIDDIDSANLAANLEVSLVSFRFQDASGVVFSMDGDASSTNDVAVNDAATNDDMAIKSSSSNPDTQTITVKEDDTTDDVLVLAYKLDVDDDSSDITLTDLATTVTFGNYDVDLSGTVDGSDDSVVAAGAEAVIDSLVFKIDGEEYTADLGAVAIANGAGTAVYSVDLSDEDVVLEGGDVTEVKVYITFAAQDTNYNEAMTVRVSMDQDDITAESENDDTFTTDTGTKQGGLLTLSLTGGTVDVTNITEAGNSNDTDDSYEEGTFTFYVTIDAEDGDVEVDATSIVETLLDPAANTIALSLQIVNLDGDATENTAGTDYTVEDGDSNTFSIVYTINPDAAGTYYVRLDSIDGITVDETSEGINLVVS